jgi:hypothetical protein
MVASHYTINCNFKLGQRYGDLSQSFLEPLRLLWDLKIVSMKKEEGNFRPEDFLLSPRTSWIHPASIWRGRWGAAASLLRRKII